MRKGTPFLLIVFLLATLSLGGCSAMFSPDEREPVSFIVTIPADKFSDAYPITVSVWNARQLAVRKKMAGCVASSGTNPQATPEITCPEGVVYEPVTPQEFTFEVSSINETVSLPNTSVRVGEAYEIGIHGENQDNCNTTFSSARGTAKTTTIVLDNLVWGTTQVGCTFITEPAP